MNYPKTLIKEVNGASFTISATSEEDVKRLALDGYKDPKAKTEIKKEEVKKATKKVVKKFNK